MERSHRIRVEMPCKNRGKGWRSDSVTSHVFFHVRPQRNERYYFAYMSTPPLVILTFLRPHQVTQKPRKQNQAFRAHETVDFKNLIFAFIFSAIGQNSKKCHFFLGVCRKGCPQYHPKEVPPQPHTHTRLVDRARSTVKW